MRRKWLALFLGMLLVMPILVGATADGRSYVSGRFALELDGVFAGWIYSAEGGHAVGEVATELVGSTRIPMKHIGAVKYEDITIEVGASMSKAVYDWVSASLMGQAVRKNGAIIAADFNGRELNRMTFSNALITEIGMPALDAASKDAAKMTIKFRPELTRQVRKGGAQLPGTNVGTKHKQWLPSNFRLKIDGLDAPVSRVNKIEALTIKQKIVTDSIGDGRDPQKEPTSLEFPNLVITFPEGYGDPFYAWHQDFVIAGRNGQEQEKGGTLEYLAADGKTVLFTLTFKHLGIFKLTPDKAESGSEQLRRLKAEMFCEDIEFAAAN